MKIFNYLGESVEFTSDVERKRVKLLELYSMGFEYLVLDTDSSIESINWLIAGFNCGMTLVLLPSHVPNEQKNIYTRQLPSHKVCTPQTPAVSKVPINSNEIHFKGVIIFTSGSTGIPKGVFLDRLALNLSAQAHADHLKIKDVPWLLDLPLFHISGFSILYRAYYLDENLISPQKKLSTAELSFLLDNEIVRGLSIVPTVLFRYLKTGMDSLSEAKFILVGGALCPPQLYRQAIDRRWPIIRTYGLTETASQVATELRPGGGLDLLPGVKVNVSLNKQISISTPSLSRGYYQNGALTPLPLKDGFYETGDVGLLNSNKLEVLGRLDDLIISGGLNVFPTEIEVVALSSFGCDECCVFSVKNLEWGESVAIAWTGDCDKDSLEKYLRANLDQRKIPKFWLKLQSLPKSPTGKVLRSDLKLELEKKIQ